MLVSYWRMCGLSAAVQVSAALMLPGCMTPGPVGGTHSLGTGGSGSGLDPVSNAPPSPVGKPPELDAFDSQPSGASATVNSATQSPTLLLVIVIMVAGILATRVPVTSASGREKSRKIDVTRSADEASSPHFARSSGARRATLLRHGPRRAPKPLHSKRQSH